MALSVFVSAVFLLLSLNPVVDGQVVAQAICPQCFVAPCPCPLPITLGTVKPITLGTVKPITLVTKPPITIGTLPSNYTIGTIKPVTLKPFTPCQPQLCVDIYCYSPLDSAVAARRKRQAEQLIATSGCGCPPIPTCAPPVTEITTTTPRFVVCPLIKCAQVLCAAPSRRRRQIAEEKIISTYNCTGCPPPTCPPFPVLGTVSPIALA